VAEFNAWLVKHDAEMVADFNAHLAKLNGGSSAD